MNCPDDHQLAAFTAGQLPAGQAQAVHAHIAGCSRCSATMAALGQQQPHASGNPSGTHPSSPPGSSLSRYRRRQELGAGGMGVVYLADDTVLQRSVALKIIRPDAFGHHPGELGARFVREAQALARINHPNVVGVYDAGFDEGEGAFIAMEHVQGEDLAHWLSRRPAPWEVVAMMLPVGQALAALHAAGLVHRDVKPSNVLVTEGGVPKLGDFGLVAPATPDATRVTRMGVAVGTPAYMAPEHAGSGEIDARSDQYAFFVSLLEGLAGERISGPGATVRLVAEARRGRGLPVGLWDAIERGLQPRPEARFVSMEAAVQALQPFADPVAYKRRGTGRILLTIAAVCLGPGLLCSGGYAIGRWTAPSVEAAPTASNADAMGVKARGLWYKPTGERLGVSARGLHADYFGYSDKPATATLTVLGGKLTGEGTYRVERSDLEGYSDGCVGDVEWTDDSLVVTLTGAPRCTHLSGGWTRTAPLKGAGTLQEK